MARSNHVKVGATATNPRPAVTAENPTALIEAARAAAFDSTAPDVAFRHFLPLAEAVATEDLAVFTGQPLLMLANVKEALSAIEPHLASAVLELREPRLTDVLELPSLVLALEFATERVPVAALSSGDIDRMLAEGAPWRELMLSFFEVASHPLLGLLPRERVKAIRQGSGKLDTTQDFVALHGLFTEFAAVLDDKHPFPADKIERLGELGATLVQQVRPSRAPAPALKRSPESVLRDQFASLVVDRYDYLQVLATVALGKRLADELLPALRSSVALGSADVPPAPAPTGSPAGGAVTGPSKA